MIHKIFIVFLLFSITAFSQPMEKNRAPETLDFDYKASPRPDRIILTWSKNDLSTQTVTWRTDTTVTDIMAKIVKVTPDVDFYREDTTVEVTSTTVKTIDQTVQYHKAVFTDLEPNTYYAYRVKADEFSSEWVQFKTADKNEDNPFSFIYLGDAQNDLLRLWSRVVRMAYKKAPEAKFMLHAGDMINHSQNNYEWGEWFKAASFIFKEMPQIVIPGNHEYVKNDAGHKTGITPLYGPQFNFPTNGLEGLDDTNYFIDYGNTKIICLNSNEEIDKQTDWLEKVLKENDSKWVVVTFHHPVFSTAKDRHNEGINKKWKPLLDKYNVDLVLQGHDHAYGRGTAVQHDDGRSKNPNGPVYVVSVSGRKMYELGDGDWMQKKAENTQTYQVITIDNNELYYKAYTTDDELFDGFKLKKRKGKHNELTEIK